MDDTHNFQGEKMRLFALLLLMASLAGCYETDKPVLEKGEKSPFSGSFSCKSNPSGKIETFKVTELKDGFWFLANYQYVDNEGEISLFRKLPSGMFLVQQKEKNEKYQYAFLDVVDKNTFIFLIPDTVSKEAYIDALLKKHKIDVASKGLGSIRLVADNRALLDFFAAHDKSILSVAMTCQKQ